VSRGSVNRLPLAQFALSARTNGRLEWSSDSDLLVRGTACEAAPAGCGSREDWWSVPLSGANPVNLTRGLASIPTELWRTDDGRSWAGLAEGRIWRLYPKSRRVDRLSLPRRVERLVWPVSRCTDWLCPRRTASYSRLIVSVEDRDTAAEYELKLANTSLRRIPKPAAGAEFIGYSARSRSTAYYLSDRDGLRLWLTRATQPLPQLLVDGNQFVRGLQEAAAQRIQYTSLDGEALTGWVLFPLGYRPGAKYPLIVWVYPGLVYGAAVPSLLRLGGAFNEFNMQVAAAKGYAVLVPSMPLNPFGSSDDPMLRLRSGVLPAVDKVVALGVADAQQLYLLGHSFGGFATNGLVTQTNRFAAAVSISGFADLLSLYSQFDQGIRYSDAPQEMLTSPGLLEVGQARMGAPPWRDLDRYLRNSPIVHIDAVCTPLLIVDGDLDYVGIQQSEEVFTSLYRQGKRVRFIRYWGEGHVLRSAANIEDMWGNIFAWLAAASNRSERPDAQDVCGHSSQRLQ
jgi:dipeptidyl aminopeptidase/acylaminoacyl peptidase